MIWGRANGTLGYERPDLPAKTAEFAVEPVGTQGRPDELGEICSLTSQGPQRDRPSGIRRSPRPGSKGNHLGL